MPSDQVFPKLTVVPMGWTHALDLAQNFFENLVAESLNIPREKLLREGLPAPRANEGVVAVYVDNYIIAAEDKELAEIAFDKVKKSCQAAGLPTHDETRGARQLTGLGWLFDGEKSEIRPTAKRVWRFYLAIDYVLAHPQLSSKQLEVLIGHFTFLALLRRPLLSIMLSVYAFIQKDYRRPRLLWPSIIRELRWMRATCPLIVCHLAAPVSGRVVASDASLDGQGVTVAMVAPDEAAEALRFPEL